MPTMLGVKHSEHWTQIPPGHSQSLRAAESQLLGLSTFYLVSGQAGRDPPQSSGLHAWCPGLLSAQIKPSK